MDYCNRKNISCWKPQIPNILCFLTELYEKGLGYSSINTAKSALSSILGYVDKCSIGQHPLIIKFMKGVSKLRPPMSRYSVTWDANKVLELFTSWEDNEVLCIKKLSIKLVSLMALTTAQRVQSLAAINIKNITWGNPTQIKLSDNLKCTSISRPNPVLIVNEFKQNNKLCVLSCLKVYLNRTNSLRKSDNLFISITKPYCKVTPATLSRWLKIGLSLAGVDISIFKGHSFRHAATSKAAGCGVSVDCILSRVGWSAKCQTFAKFYNRPVDNRIQFGESILQL